MTSEQVRRTKVGNSTAKAVLCSLASRAIGSEGPEGWSFPSKQRIAEDTELALRQVQRVMQAFRSIGLVVPLTHDGKKGFQIAIAMLGQDLSQSFSAVYGRLQGLQNTGSAAQENVCQTHLEDTENVCQTHLGVCETQTSVCETFPPHPLNRVRKKEGPMKVQPAASSLFGDLDDQPIPTAGVSPVPFRIVKGGKKQKASAPRDPRQFPIQKALEAAVSELGLQLPTFGGHAGYDLGKLLTGLPASKVTLEDLLRWVLNWKESAMPADSRYRVVSSYNDIIKALPRFQSGPINQFLAPAGSRQRTQNTLRPTGSDTRRLGPGYYPGGDE